MYLVVLWTLVDSVLGYGSWKVVSMGPGGETWHTYFHFNSFFHVWVYRICIDFPAISTLSGHLKEIADHLRCFGCGQVKFYFCPTTHIIKHRDHVSQNYTSAIIVIIYFSGFAKQYTDSSAHIDIHIVNQSCIDLDDLPQFYIVVNFNIMITCYVVTNNASVWQFSSNTDRTCPEFYLATLLKYWYF